MKIFNRNFTKSEILLYIKRFVIIMFANFLLAFASGIFLVPLKIITGGVSGIGIIVEKYLPGTVDLTVGILTWGLLVVGLLLLGRKFFLKTLLSSIFYPLFFILVMRVPFFADIGQSLANNADLTTYLVCALFGGALSGVACAMNFAMGGSTGGVDVISLAVNKFFPIVKVSGVAFVVDASIIVSGMIVFWEKGNSAYITQCLINILSALVFALMIELIYISRNKNIVVEIVSEKYLELNDFIQNKLDRGSTIYEAEGGYKSDKKKVIKTIIGKSEYYSFREDILRIDPHAFTTFTITQSVIGNGFSHYKVGDEPRKDNKYNGLPKK